MDKEKWLKEAKRYALHAYCYEGMIDEFPEHFDQEYAGGFDPYESVDLFAVDAGLDRADGFYGINSGQKFAKLWTAGNPEDPEMKHPIVYALDGMRLAAKADANLDEKTTGYAETATTRVAYYPVSQTWGHFGPGGKCTVRDMLRFLSDEVAR